MTLRFLADENWPSISSRLLREAGNDVVEIARVLRGATDARVLALATAEDRTLLTFGRDYGRLSFQRRLPSPPSVIYCRFIPATPAEPAEMVIR